MVNSKVILNKLVASAIDQSELNGRHGKWVDNALKEATSVMQCDCPASGYKNHTYKLLCGSLCSHYYTNK